MNDYATWVALAAAIGAIIGLLRFWQSYADRLSRAESSSKSALEDALEVKRRVEVVDSALAANVAAFALYRETIAREYITRDVMREFEQRVTDITRQNTERLVKDIEGVSKRFDNLLLALTPKN